MLRTSEGRISDVSPAYWPFYFDNVTWPASFIMVADHVYQQYGDVRVIEQNYPAMRKWIKHMETYLKDDLMPRDIYGDWCVPPESPELIHSKDPTRKTEAAVLGTTYFYRLLRLMENDANLVGKPDDAEEYSQLAGRLLAAFNKTYFHAATSQYSNGSATSSVLPLAFRMVPEENRQSVADALIRKISEQNNDHVSTGLIGGQWLMQTLSDYGHPDVAYQIASQPDYPSWGYMVEPRRHDDLGTLEWRYRRSRHEFRQSPDAGGRPGHVVLPEFGWNSARSRTAGVQAHHHAAHAGGGPELCEGFIQFALTARSSVIGRLWAGSW